MEDIISFPNTASTSPQQVKPFISQFNKIFEQNEEDLFLKFWSENGEDFINDKISINSHRLSDLIGEELQNELKELIFNDDDSETEKKIKFIKAKKILFDAFHLNVDKQHTTIFKKNFQTFLKIFNQSGLHAWVDDFEGKITLKENTALICSSDETTLALKIENSGQITFTYEQPVKFKFISPDFKIQITPEPPYTIIGTCTIAKNLIITSDIKENCASTPTCMEKKENFGPTQKVKETQNPTKMSIFFKNTGNKLINLFNNFKKLFSSSKTHSTSANNKKVSLISPSLVQITANSQTEKQDSIEPSVSGKSAFAAKQTHRQFTLFKDPKCNRSPKASKPDLPISDVTLSHLVSWPLA